MSKLLFAESPLVVQPNVAKAIGLNEAIILQQLEYWMRRPGGKIINGEHWIYNSVKEWKKQFPFWSEATISRTLENLEDAQLIKTGCYNKMTTDRTKWYTVNYATVDLLDLLITLEEEQEAAEEGVTNAFQQNEICNSADWGNLPETTSEKTHTPESMTPKDQCWQEVGELFPMTLNGSDWQKWNNAWLLHPDKRRHDYAHARALKANPRRFKFYLDDFMGYDPDKSATWGDGAMLAPPNRPRFDQKPQRPMRFRTD